MSLGAATSTNTESCAHAHSTLGHPAHILSALIRLVSINLINVAFVLQRGVSHAAPQPCCGVALRVSVWALQLLHPRL